MDPARNLQTLRHRLAALMPLIEAPSHPVFTLGIEAIDRRLGKGLARGAVHEILVEGLADAPAGSGFTAGLALRASRGGAVIWVREQESQHQTGFLYAQGLAEFGLSPDQVTLVIAPDTLSALRAAHEASRCGVLGAIILEIWGRKRLLDHTASRRLSLAAQDSGVPVLLLRPKAEPAPSAAQTRWQVKADTSRSQIAGLPGNPTFRIRLDKHRTVPAGTEWIVEWDHDAQDFRLPALSGAVVSPVFHRPVAQIGQARRRSTG